MKRISIKKLGLISLTTIAIIVITVTTLHFIPTGSHNDVHTGTEFVYLWDNGVHIDIVIKDRNAWYLDKAYQELADIEGPLNKQVIDAIGPEETAEAIDIWKKLIGVLELGEHRPGHFKAFKK